MKDQIEYTLKITIDVHGHVNIMCKSEDEDAPCISGFGSTLKDAIADLSDDIEYIFKGE